MLEILLGGLLAILGGVIATYYQAKNARKIRMEEIVAEKKVQINAEAYAKMKNIISMLAQKTLQRVLKEIMLNESWFLNNRLFFPGKFPKKWFTLRNGVAKAIRLQRQKKTPKKTKELTALKNNLSEIAKEAIDEIYKDMNLERIEIEKERIS